MLDYKNMNEMHKCQRHCQIKDRPIYSIAENQTVGSRQVYPKQKTSESTLQEEYQ